MGIGLIAALLLQAVPGTGLIATGQAFLAGPVAVFVAVVGLVKFAAGMLAGEHGHGTRAGAVIIGVSIALWSLRFITFVQNQS